ncbi:hypothetical protein PMAYCL1PPCAC_21839, partial [Pristionchus mayeri]
FIIAHRSTEQIVATACTDLSAKLLAQAEVLIIPIPPAAVVVRVECPVQARLFRWMSCEIPKLCAIITLTSFGMVVLWLQRCRDLEYSVTACDSQSFR